MVYECVIHGVLVCISAATTSTVCKPVFTFWWLPLIQAFSKRYNHTLGVLL